METHRENYPLWIVGLCNLTSIAIYVIGATILAGLNPWLPAPYLLFCFWLEMRVMKKSCVNCHYYGKTCGTGKGHVCAILFKRGNPQRFAAKEATWKEILTDFLVSLIPLLAGIILSFLDFSWLRLGLLAVLIMLATVGTGAIRGNLLCKYCEQGRIGCPALKLFEKTNEENPNA